ncbi:MAG: hypothetical protein WC979_07225, partial [Candidatus Pacearchaeota archaeon]|jgi:hypothetical protein
MKKILTRAQESKKTKRNQLIIGLILVGLMLFSTAGYAIGNYGEDTATNGKVDYKGITFTRNADYWDFSLNGQSYMTQYNPEEIKDINVSTSIILSDYSDKPLYFATESGQLELELATNLANSVLRLQSACISEKNCENNLPIKNCLTDNVIVIKEATNQNEGVYQEGNCVFITAEYSNLTKYEDAFLFKILKI